VPQPSQQVRAYVRREQASYQAVHPNGFAPLGEHPLLEPVEVQRAREALGGYTFLFPLELVALVVILSGLIAGVGAFIARSPQRRKQVKSLLAVPAVLSTVCLGGGVVRILSATHGWLPRLGFTAAGVIATAALGALSFWLLRGARRVPEAPAEAE
jgi:membrane associated rhomboid family serine protease